MKRLMLFLILWSPLLVSGQEVQSPKPGITIYGSPCLIGNLTLSCVPKTCDSITIIAGDSIEFCTFQQIFLNVDSAYWLRWQFTGATNLPDTILHVYPDSVPVCHSPRWDTAGIFLVEVFYNGWLSAYPNSDCYQYGPSHWFIEVTVLPNPNGISEASTPTTLVYPNPTSGAIRFGEEVTNVRIVDLLGREVINSDGYEIDLSTYPDGVYVCYATRMNGAIEILRVHKQAD